MGVSGQGVSGIPFTVDASGNASFTGSLSYASLIAAGSGITSGTGTIYGSSVTKAGPLIETTM